MENIAYIGSLCIIYKSACTN